MTDRKCENPKCGKELTPERRRFCSSQCQSREGQRRFRLKRVGAGLCYRCGAVLDPRSKSLCTNCLDGNRKYQGSWRAELPTAKLAAIQKQNRLAARARRAADPGGCNRKRREYYKAKRATLLTKRRAKEGQWSREEYLKLVRKTTRAPVNVAKSKNKGGRPRGIEEATLQEAKHLLARMHEWEEKEGTRRGGVVFAARKVYGPTVEPRKAVQRANKTLQKYRKTIIGTKPPA